MDARVIAEPASLVISTSSSLIASIDSWNASLMTHLSPAEPVLVVAHQSRLSAVGCPQARWRLLVAAVSR
jgi:hypothetical protein